MFANWLVLMNRTIILQFVNGSADHMFIKSQDSITKVPRDLHSNAVQ